MAPTSKKQKMSLPLWDLESDEHAAIVDLFVSGKLDPVKHTYKQVISLRPTFADGFDNQSVRNGVKAAKEKAKLILREMKKEAKKQKLNSIKVPNEKAVGLKSKFILYHFNCSY
jgi:hypothetical protein